MVQSTVSPVLGVALTDVVTAADIAAGLRKAPHKTGIQVWGDDGLRYVFAKANAAIPASTAVASVDPVTFLATASAGTYLSPATSMVTGDYGWFSKASV